MVMSSIIRPRKVVILAISDPSCLKGWASIPTILSDRRRLRPSGPRRFHQSGLVQSLL